jgi:hypothetical protein
MIGHGSPRVNTVMRSSGYPRAGGIAVTTMLLSNRWLVKSSAGERRCPGAYWGYSITPAKPRLAPLQSLGHHNCKVS